MKFDMPPVYEPFKTKGKVPNEEKPLERAPVGNDKKNDKNATSGLDRKRDEMNSSGQGGAARGTQVRAQF